MSTYIGYLVILPVFRSWTFLRLMMASAFLTYPLGSEHFCKDDNLKSFSRR